MSNKSEYTKVKWKGWPETGGWRGGHLVAAFIAILIWDIQLPHIRMNPAVKPFTNIVAGIADCRLFVTYLSWFLWLWLTKRALYASYRPDALDRRCSGGHPCFAVGVLSFLFWGNGRDGHHHRGVPRCFSTAASALGFFGRALNRRASFSALLLRYLTTFFFRRGVLYEFYHQHRGAEANVWNP